jgi:hypothetical protein
MERDILDAATDYAIDALRTLQVKVPVQGQDCDISTTVQILSSALRSGP